MILVRRERFNRKFSPERYNAFLTSVQARSRVPIDFRLCETPCFFPASLMNQLADAAVTMVTALLSSTAYRAAADEAVPLAFRVPHGEARPTFVQVDFGLVRTESGVEGRLVELQAFPSLYAFQTVLSAAYLETWQLTGLTPFLGGLDEDTYLRICRRAIVGDHDPDEVVLMEVDPLQQKTLPDFALTGRLWGVRTVDVRDVVQEGRRLWTVRDGTRTPISRIYNRVIPDDLARRDAAVSFDYRDDLDVEWAGGPDWFFRISKFSLPWLSPSRALSPSQPFTLSPFERWIPETHYLSDLSSLPGDRENWVLKPLFSFAGGGIVFAPTDEDFAAIPIGARGNYILQRRVSFTPVIDTPHGPTQAEIRIMLIADSGTYRPVIPLVRMGRGKMMGVDHNKELAWVGASAALIEQVVVAALSNVRD